MTLEQVRLKTAVVSIVDDDESVREATKRLVSSLDYVTAMFASAKEFLQSERVHDTSCLISDVQMPGLNDLELQRRLIDDDHCIPIIFITAIPSKKSGPVRSRHGRTAFSRSHSTFST